MSVKGTKEKILDGLKGIRDPKTGCDLASLGAVKEAWVDRGHVFIHLEAKNLDSPTRVHLKGLIKSELKSLEGVKNVKVEISSPVCKEGHLNSKRILEGIRCIIAVASGKGGVGKTTVAVNIAMALRENGYQVGLMDGDIYGPNIPLMLGIPCEVSPRTNVKDKMIPVKTQGLKVVSMGVLVAPDRPMIWRGPVLHRAVTQFLEDVDWGELDFLIVDLPPGTGDVQLSLVQRVSLAGAVIVTTSQEAALMDARKAIAMFAKTGVPILGIVENMSGDIFGQGGGAKIAMQHGVAFLGEIPLDVDIRKWGDQGKAIVSSAPESVGACAFKCMAVNVLGLLGVCVEG